MNVDLFTLTLTYFRRSISREAAHVKLHSDIMPHLLSMVTLQCLQLVEIYLL